MTEVSKIIEIPAHPPRFENVKSLVFRLQRTARAIAAASAPQLHIYRHCDTWLFALELISKAANTCRQEHPLDHLWPETIGLFESNVGMMLFQEHSANLGIREYVPSYPDSKNPPR